MFKASLVYFPTLLGSVDTLKVPNSQLDVTLESKKRDIIEPQKRWVCSLIIFEVFRGLQLVTSCWTWLTTCLENFFKSYSLRNKMSCSLCRLCLCAFIMCFKHCDMLSRQCTWQNLWIGEVIRYCVSVRFLILIKSNFFLSVRVPLFYIYVFIFFWFPCFCVTQNTFQCDWVTLWNLQPNCDMRIKLQNKKFWRTLPADMWKTRTPPIEIESCVISTVLLRGHGGERNLGIEDRLGRSRVLLTWVISRQWWIFFVTLCITRTLIKDATTRTPLLFQECIRV